MAANSNQPVVGDDGLALPIVIVGHVDHGKSTLVGRLLHDTGSVPETRLSELRKISGRRGQDIEWSFLLDSLQVERDQGITLDTTQIWFRTARRRYVIIDAPGHKEFLKNMVTGASRAEAAILVVDAKQGVSEQTRRHAHLLELLGVDQVSVAVNKMDLVDYAEQQFGIVAEEVRGLLAGLGIAPTAIIPLSARNGDNVAAPGAAMGWYRGPTLVQALDGFLPQPLPVDQPLRLPIQDVYRLGERRVLVGRIESGRLRVGDAVRYSPSGRTARIASFETWNRAVPQLSAAAGESVAVTLDDDLFIERGGLLSDPGNAPPEGHVAVVRLFWLGRAPLARGRRLRLRAGTSEHGVTVESIDRVVDTQGTVTADADRLERNGIAVVTLRSRTPMALYSFREGPAVGRGVLIDAGSIAGGFIVERMLPQGDGRHHVTPIASSVSRAEREAAHGHRGAVIWMTGLSGAGKSTLAMAAQRRLFMNGRLAYVLDGDNLRQGLSCDLGFEAADRSENIRRAAEVARLFADAGFIALVSLISPAGADRARARAIVGAGFHEVFIDADLDTCRQRDPKGLYAKAASGAVAAFTGISAPYERPTSPDLTIDTARLGVDAAVDRLLAYLSGCTASDLTQMERRA